MPKASACLLMPVYNHAQYLPQLLPAVLALNLPMIAVNDGSTDATAELLRARLEIKTIHFPTNQGKGAALAAGLRLALELGFTWALTLDADGQHDPREVPRLLAALDNHPDWLVIGAREYGQAGAPRKSRWGRAFSNFWVWVETGLKLPDTQSGFRVYPVKIMNGLEIFSRRFGWEIEALVKAAWAGVQVVSIPVRISYLTKTSSHFRTLYDFFLVSLVNIGLLGWRLFLLPHPTLVAKEKIVWPQSFKARIYFLWHQYLWQAEETPGQRSTAIGLGVFCGILPVWGLQTLLALFLAQRFHLNKVLVLAGANISLPPMIPFILYAALSLGHYLFFGEWSLHLAFANVTWQMVQSVFKEFILGSIFLALLAALLSGSISYTVIRAYHLWKSRPGAR